jgi:hypothetical protein
MKTGMSLVELARAIESNAAGKKDFIAVANRATMQVVDGKPLLEIEDHGAFPLQALPLRQIATYADVPAKYFDRMLAEAPDLAAINVNAWFRKKPDTEKRMVRTMHGSSRAFLSNGYQRIENDRIANVTLPVLAEFPGIQVKSTNITESRMYIQAVVPSLEAEVRSKDGRRVGDLMQAGVVIQNSEVGLGAVDVLELDWRLRCLNGMVGESLYRRAHVGRKVDDTEALWADDTRKADDDALMLKVRDMVRAALDGARFRARVERMNGLAEASLASPVKAVEVLDQVLPVTQGDKDGILKSLIEGGDLSGWGLLNAVTHQAHAAASYDRSVEFEAMGGKLLNLPAGEWKRVLEAA